MGRLTERILHVLGLDSATPIGAQRPLKEVGLDSLMAVELRNSLVRSAGIALPATLLFDYPTLDALASFLGRVWKLDTGVALAHPASAAAEQVAGLSDAQAEAMLLEELALGESRRDA